MKLDIENILLRRMFAIKHTEHLQIYNRQMKDATDLLEKVENGDITFFEKDGFVYFYDENEIITNVVKIVQMEEVEGFEGISYRENGKLYRWNFVSKNELIFRNRGIEEKKRLKFLPSGFYYVSDKIDAQSENLYWISQRLVSGEFTHHKIVGQRKGDAGTVYAFTERKNKGKIFRLVDIGHLLIDEQKQMSSDHLILSAYMAHNDVVFEKILRLYVRHGSKVADMTYGQGRFWTKIPKGLYEIMPSDLTTGVDCRNLPYDDNSVDCVVFDPPYLSTPFGKTSVFDKGSSFEQGYKNICSRKRIYEGSGLEDHEALVDLEPVL